MLANYWRRCVKSEPENLAAYEAACTHKEVHPGKYLSRSWPVLDHELSENNPNSSTELEFSLGSE